MNSPYIRILDYGGPGVGKTAFGVSAFWDYVRREPVVRDGVQVRGRLLTFGGEDNPALDVPEEYVRNFASTPNLDSREWVDEFDKYVTGLLTAARKGTPALDVLCVDGMSEFDLLYEEVFRRMQGDSADKFAKWDALLSDLFSIIQKLQPKALQAHVVVTARVTEKKKGIKSGGREITAGDPGFIDWDYYPMLRGQFRFHFPHYFNLVTYSEQDSVLVKGVRQQVYLKNLIRQGEYYIKNQWAHKWGTTKPTWMNTTFWEVYDKLVTL
jgi:hypothetical protein